MFNIQSDGDKGVALGSLNGLAKMLALKYWRDKMCVCFGLGYLRKAHKCKMRKNGQGSFVSATFCQNIPKQILPCKCNQWNTHYIEKGWHITNQWGYWTPPQIEVGLDFSANRSCWRPRMQNNHKFSFCDGYSNPPRGGASASWLRFFGRSLLLAPLRSRG